MPGADLSYAVKLPPEKAVEYFRAKGHAFSWDWQDTWQEAHAKAFTVAKAMRMDVLQDIRGEVDRAIADGATFEEFRRGIEPRLKARGWWGRKTVADETGAAREVRLGSPRRLKTIYHANVQSAYMAGRWKQFQENSADRPYLQYVAIMDSRTRPAHAALDGKVFRIDDPFWDSFSPPNGWGCRCRTRALTAEQAGQYRLGPGASGDRLSEREIADPDGVVRKLAVYDDPLTGMKISPDPGWSHNPGKSAWFPELDTYDYDVAKRYVEGGLTGPDFAAFFKGQLKGDYPVAVLDPDYKAAIGSGSQAVYLSDESLAKNVAGHPELGLEAYQSLPQVIQDAQLVVQDGSNTFVFFKKGEDFYFGAVKATQSGKKNFLTSFRSARASDVEAIKKKGKVLKDEL